MIFEEKKINILLIEDEDYDVRRVTNTLKPFEDRIKIVDTVSNGKAALELLQTKKKQFDVVIMDYQIAGGIMGETLIQKIKEIDASVQIIVITKMTINITDYSFANKLMKAGAFWYCTKYPGDIEDFIYQPTDFIMSIFNAHEKCLLERERFRSYQKMHRNVEDILLQKKMIGESPMMLELKDEITKFANSNVNTLIRGSSGTGKELVAYNIHYRSNRKYENFVIINCGSLPSQLVESELFGYEKGAFTGADKKKLGLFEIANHGTIFLDEITELPLQAQVKLLRVIQDGEIEKIGRTERIKVDVRIIAATNKNIEEEVREKRFREDLYYRLNVLPINVSDLKKRTPDIPLLIDYFLSNISIDMGKDKPDIPEETLQVLLNYDWPGNVRELKNVVQRMLFTAEKNITPLQARRALGISEDLKPVNEFGFGDVFNHENIIPLKDMERVLRERYFKFVRLNSSSDTEAANKLGLAPPNYYRMAKELGLKKTEG
ncbi:MAG: transcriptional regulator [Ignavibacteria bacterium RIFOXYB2_FULL_35_12]|nr:MAG: transcriptional regulator [Ignavibacteria bacterium GWA2_36_19]OGU54378.1 MAG: transcriptional regulator [Ignavibacteria bacterium GWC2_35_8]OGU57744.1 MAG: transcriptional regulator [Ignavibacteria bacterium GWF2_35_20]OGU81603.1 MAG: transcriptional regulator [Ignavibacteria bacterium RIFOXYA2_FULL_35_9]OGU89182.1 MAG: transcriptional regulator [Ignavibacteria bacterium RIFOXYA12_FULL_35_25]OGU89726.1 MAG: transcriptional regulator [Ignavibacteria bacterium RIFOXYC12_FULL_35_11]OGU9